MPKRKLLDIFKLINRNGPIHPTKPELGACWIYTGPYNERRRMPEYNCDGEKLIPYRVVWELVKGEPWPNGLIALHSCDNRRCCNPDHFGPGSIAQNNAEKEIRERDSGMSHRDVRIVRFLIGTGVSRKAVAALMEVSISTIHAIATGQNHSRTTGNDTYETLQQTQPESNRLDIRQTGDIQQQLTKESKTSE